MRDIVERLVEASDKIGLCDEAADEIDRLREALNKIATDAYDASDEKVRWEQPTMIWQSVAKIALGQKPAKL